MTLLAHPNGKITGISLLSPELDGKRQDILIEALPGARRIAAISDSKVTSPQHVRPAAFGSIAWYPGFGFWCQAGRNCGCNRCCKDAGAEAANFLVTPLFSLPGTRNNQIVIERVIAQRLPSIFSGPRQRSRCGSWIWSRFTDV